MRRCGEIADGPLLGNGNLHVTGRFAICWESWSNKNIASKIDVGLVPARTSKERKVEMSKISFFNRTATVAPAAPVAPAQPAKKDWKDPNAEWRSLPIKGSQFKPLARLLRTKDLMAITDPATRKLVANVAVFDDETGRWNFDGLTRGVAADLIDSLMQLPNVGFSKVTTETTVPTTEKPAEINGLPEGYEVRVGKRGPYLAKKK